ncbi:unnamed protein product [Paramecium octaurelia]|uniref:Uncharacterized protein n=1 Tax=Paramecium octaurelia TaxID=43137 RepID=A0A8S1T3D9_PAROT|nr:unnamed protein product [Paramecium octaurelia]
MGHRQVTRSTNLNILDEIHIINEFEAIQDSFHQCLSDIEDYNRKILDFIQTSLLGVDLIRSK